MKNLIVNLSLGLITVIAMSSTSHAFDDYHCVKNSDRISIRLYNNVKMINIQKADLNSKNGKADFNTLYQNQSFEWAGSKKYDLRAGDFGNQGAFSVVVNDEMIARKAMGKIKYINNNMVKIQTIPCSKVSP